MNRCIVPVIPKTPTFTVSPSDATIETGTTVTLSCVTASSGLTTYRFVKDGIEEASQPSGIYTLSAATTDSADWTCTAAINSMVSSESSSITITVEGMSIVELDSVL